MAILSRQNATGVQNHGSQLYIVSIAMPIVAALFIGVRLATRISKNKLGVDDYCVIGSLVFSISLSATLCVAVNSGFGKHMIDLKHGPLVEALKMFYVAQIVYKMVVTLNKISILSLYLRIFIGQTFRRIVYGAIVFIAVSGAAFIVTTIVQCMPLAAAYDKTIKPATCINSTAFWFTYAVINIITDVAILLLPSRQIKHLNLPTREKVGLFGVFTLGAFVCVTSIVRTTTLNVSAKTPDPTWNDINSTTWTVVEANVGIVCACLPILKQPLQAIFPRIFSTGGTSHSRSGPNYVLESKTDTVNGHSRTGSNYPHWGNVDGNIMSSIMPGRNTTYAEGRESEERIIDDGGAGIIKTTEMSVSYGDSNSIPSLEKDPHVEAV
ncbi:MAG: hypothetical protein M1827_004015 [Pycnora praestabilis]|nr:MAG: hypothetical protein M1827_004015 [Pycnora praestabilis]